MSPLDAHSGARVPGPAFQGDFRKESVLGRGGGGKGSLLG